MVVVGKHVSHDCGLVVEIQPLNWLQFELLLPFQTSTKFGGGRPSHLKWVLGSYFGWTKSVSHHL